MMDLIKLFSISQGMSAIKRYSQLHLVKEESVMEHTGFVCLFTYLVCEEINSKTYFDSEKMNIGIALQKAVVHDMDEVVTGDIPRPTKYHSKSTIEVFDSISEKGINQIIRDLEIKTGNIKHNWKNAKEQNEGFIVALADLSSVVYKLWDETVLLGNKKLLMQASDVHNYIRSFKQKVDNNNDLFANQKLVIYEIIEQLYYIIKEIMKLNNPLLGTIESLRSKNGKIQATNGR